MEDSKEAQTADNTKEADDDHDELKQLNIERMMEFLQKKKVYQCSYDKCKALFDRPYRLAQHIFAHKNIRPYGCTHPNCGKAYTSKSHLDRHSRNVHMPQEKDVIYSCPRCFKIFTNRQNLKRHLNTVHKVEFSCEICDMQFKKKNQLSTHMYQHTGIKAFSCDACPETFVSLYLKKRHMRYHKSYKCQECGVEFNHWTNFQKHLKIDHQKERKSESVCEDKSLPGEFICNDCGKTFKQRCHIVRHVKIHAEANKTFMCPYENCERTYSRNSNLKQHILVKHMNIFHECTMCQAKLSTKAKLNYHIQLHYNSGMTTRPTRANYTERKRRKDEGTLKSSTALKLAGLSDEPDDMQLYLNNLQDDLHATHSGLDNRPEESCSSNSPPPVNLAIKSEYIEVEVDIPYDI